MTLAPWDYFFVPFTRQNFPDLFDPTWIAALVLLVALLVLYQVETRRLHRHPRHLDQWEWLLWTGLITFSLLIVGAMFLDERDLTGRVGLSVIAGAFGVMSVAVGLAIHRRSMRSPWLLLGALPLLVGLWLTVL